ncbi:RNA-binding protein 7 isoform X2 [Callorhinchus milii]|uniref:RNA-binding protein 7 isoform X2 n=1 Tax=Callorhinchus milii TaxID=7868 RepID=UPI001C3FE43F|nr:RNA-binding protein 7 isoform X2 [Callorhinchus milii]
MGISNDADKTLFVGNLDVRVTEEILYELFLQAGPLITVKIPKDKEGKTKQFAFVNYKHEESVHYGKDLLNGIPLFGRALNIQFRSGSVHDSREGNQAPNSNVGSYSNQFNNNRLRPQSVKSCGFGAVSSSTYRGWIRLIQFRDHFPHLIVFKDRQL